MTNKLAYRPQDLDTSIQTDAFEFRLYELDSRFDFAATLDLHNIVEEVNILYYYIKGGVASSTYGEPRTTRDLDVVIAISQSQFDPLVQRLKRQ